MREKESLCIKFVGKALLDENSNGEHTYKNKIVCVLLYVNWTCENA